MRTYVGVCLCTNVEGQEGAGRRVDVCTCACVYVNVYGVDRLEALQSSAERGAA